MSSLNSIVRTGTTRPASLIPEISSDISANAPHGFIQNNYSNRASGTSVAGQSADFSSLSNFVVPQAAPPSNSASSEDDVVMLSGGEDDEANNDGNTRSADADTSRDDSTLTVFSNPKNSNLHFTANLSNPNSEKSSHIIDNSGTIIPIHFYLPDFMLNMVGNFFFCMLWVVKLDFNNLILVKK
ncbi:unnamed protein product [Protopolystoma xenopodis]|uniref:Uncharacterized protein n=1 Tax=Protopolystoma xenopodis TaxID=117903 RepID=A0A3S5BU37_9PLAT|nr:unnamed protein product [Protopolystoma xenopodis]